MSLQDSKWGTNWLLVFIGLAALILGVVLYLYDRPPSQIYFVPDFLSRYKGQPVLFGAIGYYLPTFLHILAFCLISAGIVEGKLKTSLLICLLWLLIDGLFEIAQHPDIAKIIVPIIPDWFDKFPILENTADYFSQGRYDPLDLVAIVLGAVTAFLLIFTLHTKKKNSRHKHYNLVNITL